MPEPEPWAARFVASSSAVRTSRSVTRPPGPVPAIVRGSMPAAAARRWNRSRDWPWGRSPRPSPRWSLPARRHPNRSAGIPEAVPGRRPRPPFARRTVRDVLTSAGRRGLPGTHLTPSPARKPDLDSATSTSIPSPAPSCRLSQTGRAIPIVIAGAISCPIRKAATSSLPDRPAAVTLNFLPRADPDPGAKTCIGEVSESER